VYALALTLLVLAFVILLLLLVEVRNYRAGRTLISRRRLALRLAAGMLLMSLLAAVFVGVFVLKIVAAMEHPRLFLVYWSSCLLVAIALIWVMLADMQEVESRIAERRNEMWKEMARFVAEQVERKKAEGDDAAEGRE